MSDTTTSARSLTDWDRVDALRDEEIDLSDSPEITPEMFARAELRHRGKPVAARTKDPADVDSDTLQKRINAVLRAHNKAHQEP